MKKEEGILIACAIAACIVALCSVKSCSNQQSLKEEAKAENNYLREKLDE